MSRSLQATSLITVLSIGAFNFTGVSVTKRLSGAARCTIDACRTIFIWRGPPARGSVPPPAFPPRLCALRMPCEGLACCQRMPWLKRTCYDVDIG